MVSTSLTPWADSSSSLGPGTVQGARQMEGQGGASGHPHGAHPYPFAFVSVSSCRQGRSRTVLPRA